MTLLSVYVLVGACVFLWVLWKSGWLDRWFFERLLAAFVSLLFCLAIWPVVLMLRRRYGDREGGQE